MVLTKIAFLAIDVLLLNENSLVGNADVICHSQLNLSHFVADCGDSYEIQCSCCSLCCTDANKTCGSNGWNVNLDPIWEYGLTRTSYQFGQNVLPP